MAHLGSENLYRNRLGCGARRRNFLRCGNRPGPGQERHRGSDRPRAGAEEAADPRPFYRSADRRRPGRDRRRGQVRPEDPRPLRVRFRAPNAKRSPPSSRTSRRSIWRSTSTTTRPTSARSRCRRFRRSAARSPTTILKARPSWSRATDAAGGEAYNQDLSERRADAIKRYLVDKYGINGTDLVTVDGKSKLKDPGQPLAEVNRRVQVVNMENKATASGNASK